MAPKYFIENRYSFVVDALPIIDNHQYEVEEPDTAFERKIQREIATANRLLMANKFRLAIEKYLHIRGLIASILKPQISIRHAHLVNWNKVEYAQLSDSLVAKSADILKKTSITSDAIPEVFIDTSVQLPGEVQETLKVFESVGIKDREIRIGIRLVELHSLVKDRQYEAAERLLEKSIEITEDRTLRAALLHDLAILQEKNGKQDVASRTLRSSVQLFEKADRADLQVEALASLASAQVRAGNSEGARETLKTVGRIEKEKNLFPIMGISRLSGNGNGNGKFGVIGGSQLSSPLLKPSFSLDKQPRLIFDTGNRPSFSIGGTQPSTSRLLTTEGLSSVGDLEAQPVQLMAYPVYEQRKTAKEFTIVNQDNQPYSIRLDNNATGNLTQFYQTLENTADVSILMGYLNTYTNTVAYLTHVFNWVIPMALGDCYAAIGSYAEAEKEYLKTLNYKYLNKVVESVNLWIRLAELYVDWGDRLYRQAGNAIGDYVHAKKKYELVLRLDNTINPNSPLYQSNKFQNLKTRAGNIIDAAFVNRISVTDNPRLAMPIMRARMQLQKIANQINYIGLGVHIPPFSFEYLQNLARYFTQHAAQVEQRYIQFKSTAENEELREEEMAQQLDLATASVELEERGLDEAEEGVDVAQASNKYADTQLDNAINSKNDFNNARWKLAEYEELLAWSSAAAQDQDDEVKQTISSYSYYNVEGRRRSLVVKDLTRLKTRITHNLEAARLNREIGAAQAYKGVTQQQIDQARARVEIAEQRVEIAKLQKKHARENIEFLTGREFNSHMWYNLAREARRIAQRYLDMAIEAATLMEKAYEAETGRDLRKIKFDYGLDHLNGLLGADRLLQDIDFFSLDYIRTKSKKAQMKQSISLSDKFPMAFYQLLTTGRTFFETTLDHFDRQYPGFYLQKVRQVELVFVGLNGTEGVHGTLRNIGVSQFRRKNGSIVNQMYPADVMPLSEYNVRQDAVVFQLDNKELRLFENNGVATMWQLDLPRRTNTFNLNQILDIQLVLYYDGFFNSTLEQQIVAALPAASSASKGISMRIFTPDELFFLRNQGEAILNIDSNMFPANQTNLILKEYRFQAVGEASTINNLVFEVGFANLGSDFTFTADGNGAIDGTAGYGDPIGKSLFDQWTIRIKGADNPHLVQDGQLNLSGLQDIILFVEYDFDYV